MPSLYISCLQNWQVCFHHLEHTTTAGISKVDRYRVNLMAHPISMFFVSYTNLQNEKRTVI